MILLHYIILAFVGVGIVGTGLAIKYLTVGKVLHFLRLFED